MLFFLRKVFFVLRFRGWCFFFCVLCLFSSALCFFLLARCFFSSARCFFSCARCSGILTGIGEPENKGSIPAPALRRKCFKFVKYSSILGKHYSNTAHVYIYTKTFRNEIGIKARAFRYHYGGVFYSGGVRGGAQPPIIFLIK